MRGDGIGREAKHPRRQPTAVATAPVKSPRVGGRGNQFWEREHANLLPRLAAKFFWLHSLLSQPTTKTLLCLGQSTGNDPVFLNGFPKRLGLGPRRHRSIAKHILDLCIEHIPRRRPVEGNLWAAACGNVFVVANRSQSDLTDCLLRANDGKPALLRQILKRLNQFVVHKDRRGRFFVDDLEWCWTSPDHRAGTFQIALIQSFNTNRRHGHILLAATAHLAKSPFQILRWR